MNRPGQSFLPGGITIAMLPAEVTVAILQHVPQRQRLGQCSLVCRSWLAAAVAATIGVCANLGLSAHPTRPAHTESLSRWLQQHGSGVSDLSIVDCQYRPNGHLNLDLPFSNLRQLQELHLSQWIINASNSGNSISSSSLRSGTWADLTALTSLHLESVTLNNVGDGSDYSSITSLRRLVLSCIDCSSKGLPSLAPLTQLTCLVLGGLPYGKGKVKGIRQLSHLKHLELTTYLYDTQVLSSLPAGLTHLDLDRPMLGTDTWDVTTLTAPGLGKLTALAHLDVRGQNLTFFDPELLSNLVQLQHLSLGNCLLKHDSDALKGVDRLLAVLPGLSSLQHLDLFKCMAFATQSVQHYSALVSSSALTYLDLRDCWLQENAVLHMFQGQLCPALQQLRLGADDTHTRRAFRQNGFTYSARINALAALVAACPALQVLQLLDTVLDPDCWAPLSALEDLTGLSKLALGGDVIHDGSIALLTSLALPALRDLKVDSVDVDESVFTASWVLHLREFTQLTRLEIWENSLGCPDDRLLFKDKNGLAHLPGLFDAALPASERAQRIWQRDRSAEMMQSLLEYYSNYP